MSESEIKIVFFGTHDFAASILRGLLDDSRFSVELVITQPDKPVGRKQEMQKPAVKILAEKYNITIDQPKSLKDYHLSPISYLLAVVAQYGLKIPKHLLAETTQGFINIHTSLLPKYRGASPIQTALINGETETGVTIMKMDAGMDTGSILLQKTIKIAPDDTYATLEQKLAEMAVFALPEAILGYGSGQIVPQPQAKSKATYTKILTREDGRIDWSKSAQEIYNQYRGLTPWPGVWTTWNGKRLKFLKIKSAKLANTQVGKLQVEHDKIYFGTSNGAVEVLELQLEGAKAMTAKEFINGYCRHGCELKVCK